MATGADGGRGGKGGGGEIGGGGGLAADRPLHASLAAARLGGQSVLSRPYLPKRGGAVCLKHTGRTGPVVAVAIVGKLARVVADDEVVLADVSMAAFNNLTP